MAAKREPELKLIWEEKDITFAPLTPGTWPDLEMLFSQRGVQNGCWCMYWREPRSEFSHNYGEGNKRLLHEITASGSIPGILAYHHGKPVGWCAVAPREEFSVLGRSPTLKPVDDKPVWSIICFFVSKLYRRGGLTRLLILAAIRYAAGQGARIVEAYPIDPDARSIEYERYTGLTTTFLKTGFKEIARRSDRRPVLRYSIPWSNG